MKIELKDYTKIKSLSIGNKITIKNKKCWFVFCGETPSSKIAAINNNKKMIDVGWIKRVQEGKILYIHKNIVLFETTKSIEKGHVSRHLTGITKIENVRKIK